MNLEEIAASAENSRIRAEMWGDFVGWDTRRRGEDGFLVNQLRKFKAKKVLDVALGDGADAIYLLQKGLDVSANEFDFAFRDKAVENAKKHGFVLEPTNLDWRELSQTYEAESFDAIICMGNSLTLVEGEKNQIKSLKEFYKLLKSGGILIIDERNYQKILDNRDGALLGKLHSTGKYLYTGTEKVRSKFLKITDDVIIIEYTHVNGKSAFYKVHPFLKGKLKGLLGKSGFSEILEYGDYKPGSNVDSDFYQYVCVKA